MPPRSSIAVTNSIFNLSSLFASLPTQSSSVSATTRCAACAFSTSAPQLSIKKKRNKKRINDPYRAAQALQRKSANLARQSTLQQQRKAAMGDPIRSQPTPFIESLRGYSSNTSNVSSSGSGTAEEHVNYFLTTKDVKKQLAQSKWLTEPIPLSELDKVTSQDDPQEELKRRQGWEEQHASADYALQSITSLAQGSSKDRTRLNIQKCIEEFGRHKTDLVLPPKPTSTGQSSHILGTENLTPNQSGSPSDAELAAIPVRVGRDTGSSEVQIAILTAKINTLVNNLGKKDKHNKRNLRLLVHRRQKLLIYLRRKERGGPRWQHIVETLGINDAMWKGEISL